MPRKKQIPSTNDLVNTTRFKASITAQHRTVSNYCKEFNLTEAEVSRFLNKKLPISLKILQKHAANLGLIIEIKISKG
jgi:hypothetical protein